MFDKKRNVNLLVKTINSVAEKKAKSKCLGFLYEPEIPESLRKKKLKTNKSRSWSILITMTYKLYGVWHSKLLLLFI